MTGDELVACLCKAGFDIVRIRGRFLRHTDGRTAVVPAHAGEIIGPGLLHRILRDCRLSAEELQSLSR